MDRPNDLFEHRRRLETAAGAPLADRMRPRILEEFYGQDHIIGPGRLLRRAIEADQLSSVIFYGPPGTGKTTLARIIANTTEAHFIAINAVLAGVKDIRAAVSEAGDRRGMHGQRTILFVDEVHRFNKAQQDALLPWVENGTLILIGATTENPYFEVNKPLVSRSRIFQLRSLEDEDLRAIARAALADTERGYGRLDVDIDDEALAHLIDIADGDARGVLNALELAVETTPADEDGRVVVNLAVAEESIQRRAVLYDKEGDVHFDTVSALIKSIRGSDPDAALYWLARMVYAGEAPRFLFRRMLILAAEDVGLADPNAVSVVLACARSFEQVGLPEGRFHLAQAALYLACAPKSNSILGFFDALDAVEHERSEDVPSHLKDSSRDAEGFGHGEGYLYPHAYREHWVAQQYLPVGLQGRVFYRPSDQGFEAEVRTTLARHREAQLAAMLDPGPAAPTEVLTFTGGDAIRARDRWLVRTVGRTGEILAELRDRLLDSADLARHSLVLDLRAGSGLLTWEATRRTPEGGVWCLAADSREADALEAQAGELDEVERPIVLIGSVAGLPDLLALRGEGDLRFDAVIGRGALADPAGWQETITVVRSLLKPGGRLSLAQAVYRGASWPSSIVRLEALGKTAAARLLSAEQDLLETNPQLGLRTEDLAAQLEDMGFESIATDEVVHTSELVVTQTLIDRWFDSDRPLGSALSSRLDEAEQRQLRALFERHIGGPAVGWRTATGFIAAQRSG